jgi:hypothetical protein
MSNGFIVDAYYAPKLDMRRQAQINAVLERYGVRVAAFILNERGSFSGGGFTGLCCDCGDNDEDTDLEIYVPAEEERGRGDPLQRARRLGAQLRFCGLKTRIPAAA